MHETMSKLEAGRELDALVAEKVMGWERRDYWCGSEKLSALFHPSRGFRTCVEDGPPEYSTVIAAAWQVVEQMRAMGFGITVGVEPGDMFASCEIAKPEWRGSEVWEADTAPLAICRAALAALAEVPHA